MNKLLAMLKQGNLNLIKPEAQENDADALFERANLHLIEGRWQAAIDDYTKSLNLTGEDVERKIRILECRETCYYRLKDTQAGLADNELLSSLMRETKEAAVVLIRRGNIKMQQGYIETAIEAFSKAIELDASWARLYESRALAYLEKRDYKKALADVLSAQKCCLEHDSAMYLQFQKYLESLIAES